MPAIPELGRFDALPEFAPMREKEGFRISLEFPGRSAALY